MLRCPQAPDGVIPERFYALSRDPRARPSSHPHTRLVPKDPVRTENGSPPENRPCCARWGILGDPPPKRPPARPRGPGGGWYAGQRHGCELLSVRLLGRVQESGGCEPHHITRTTLPILAARR